MSFEALIKSLRITGNKAEVYKTILRFPGSNANQIQEISKVSKNKIYQILDDLFSQKLINISMEHPKRYWPRELDDLLEEKQQETKSKLLYILDLKANVGKILQSIQEDTQVESKTRLERGLPALIEIISGTPSKIFAALNFYIQKANESLFFVGDWELYNLGLAHSVSQAVEEAQKRSVKSFQIIALTPEFCQEPKNLPILQFFKNREETLQNRTFAYLLDENMLNMGLIIIDQNLIGFFIKNPLIKNFDFAFFIESQQLVREFKQYFSTMMKEMAKSIREIPEVPEAIKI